ncbi:hypothetical protein HUJ05_004421 [Dendroctonus ponderosae]|nr:hypothetical protein HUJ05_004421 [Dendroctonus ponderosae]
MVITVKDIICRNEDIRQRADAQDPVLERIGRRGCRWFGDMMRMDDQGLPRKTFKWNSSRRRKRGRPSRSWNEGMEAMV